MKKLLVTLALGASSFSAFAITPLWLRDVNISPDGKEIIFCYKGDIYKVKAAGGEAVRLTSQDSYESNPVWSPDGKQIAFASDRFGNFDLFIMPADGGTAKRLTMNSASEIPSTFTPDGKYVVFSASIQDPASSALFPKSGMTELYKVPVAALWFIVLFLVLQQIEGTESLQEKLVHLLCSFKRSRISASSSSSFVGSGAFSGSGSAGFESLSCILLMALTMQNTANAMMMKSRMTAIRLP